MTSHKQLSSIAAFLFLLLFSTSAFAAKSVDDVSAVAGEPPTLTGTCDVGTTVTITISDARGTELGSGSAACSKEGGWSLTPKVGLDAGVYGVEACTKGAACATGKLTVTDPVSPPTVSAVSSETSSPTLAGTCVAGSTVMLNIRKAVSREKEKVAEITGVEVTCSKEGSWSYRATAELENGTYDVTACSPDETTCDATTGELVVAVPAAPTVAALSSEIASPTLSGTCVAGSTVSLNIRKAVSREKEKVTEITGAEVTCSKEGSWLYRATAELENGTYDVTACSPDETNCDVTAGELVVAVIEKPSIDVLTATTASPTLTGTCGGAVGSTVKLSLRKAAVKATKEKVSELTDVTTSCNESGRWTIKLAAELENGDYDVTVCNPDETSCTESLKALTIAAVLDADLDGIPDDVEKGDGEVARDTDKDGTPDYLDLDSDNDGISDQLEAGVDAKSPVDTDRDGTPDYRDLDSDNDGISDVEESGGKDVDGDALLDAGEELTRTPIDTDGNKIANHLEVDSNKDGVMDIAGTRFAALDKDGDGRIDAAADLDRDGLADVIDREIGLHGTIKDTDRDGIPDSVEKGEGEVALDTDGDGTPDYLDLDSDNDGIADALEAGLDGKTPLDTDRDGTPDYRDLDSDNDGITDVDESGGKDVDGDGLLDAGAELTKALIDTDRDGTPDYLEVDSDKDGVMDIAGTRFAALDRDGDGRIDAAADLDKDGLADVIDRQIGLHGSVKDTDRDGIADSVEKGIGEITRDSDRDGIPDFEDLDSDNDGIPDELEVGADKDAPIDTDLDGTPDYRDLDSDNDGISDVDESGGKDLDRDGLLDAGEALTLAPVDTDGDKVADYIELDSDKDGVKDIAGTRFAALDTDGDGKIDDDRDADGDGIADVIDRNKAGFGTLLDSDNDGIPDSVEKGTGKEPLDTDGDGTPDYLDTDSDNDGIPDAVEAGADAENPVDTDGDGSPDYRDLDSDNDGITDVKESGAKDADNDGLLDAGEPATAAPLDTDKDGIPDYKDPDSDDDGINDIESGRYAAFDADKDGRIDDATDADSDGIADVIDRNKAGFGTLADSDFDGIPDIVEKGTGVDPLDSDRDGTPDYLDIDSDNDGIPDELEAGANKEAPSDTDEDGVPDYRDLDSDNDGITDVIESGGTDANRDGYIDDGKSLRLSLLDTDGDGIPDHLDPDSDGDGVNDIEGTDNADKDSDRDGRIDDITDLDGDGIPDVIDGAPGAPGIAVDFDNDGINDVLDLDDDNDGIPDAQEGDGATDTDGDGMPDSMDLDSDDDGLTDAFEADPSNNFDADQDGIVDNFIDSDGDGLNDGTSPTMVPANSDGDSEPNFQDLNSDNDLLLDEIEDGDYDSNGIHDSIDSGCAQCIIGNASGGGSLGWLFLLSLIALVLTRVNQLRKARYSLVALFTLSAAATNVAATDCGGSNEDFSSCLYGTIGAAYSQLEPEGVSSGWFTSDDEDTAVNIGVGWQFSPNWFAELNYADLGEAVLSNFNPNVTGTETVGYESLSAIVGYQFGDIGNTWRPYVRAGVTALDVNLSQPKLCNDGVHAQFTGGLGIEFQPQNSNFFARGGADWFSADAAVVGLTIGAYFGGNAMQNNEFANNTSDNETVVEPALNQSTPDIASGNAAVSSGTEAAGIVAAGVIAPAVSVVTDTAYLAPLAASTDSAACVCGDPNVAIFNLPNTEAKNITKLGSLPEFGNSHALSPSEFYDKLRSKYNNDPVEKQYLDYVWKSMGYSNGFADANASQFSDTVLDRGTKGLLGFGEYHGYAYSQLNTNEYDRQAFRIQSLNGHDVHYMKTCGNYMYFCGCD